MSRNSCIDYGDWLRIPTNFYYLMNSYPCFCHFVCISSYRIEDASERGTNKAQVLHSSICPPFRSLALCQSHRLTSLQGFPCHFTLCILSGSLTFLFFICLRMVLINCRSIISILILHSTWFPSHVSSFDFVLSPLQQGLSCARTPLFC